MTTCTYNGLQSYTTLRPPKQKMTRTKAEDVLYYSAEIFNTSVYMIMSTSRKRNLVEIRMAIMSILRDRTDMSLQDIGKLLGNRHHSTVINSLKTHNNLMDTNWSYKAKYVRLKEALAL